MGFIWIKWGQDHPGRCIMVRTAGSRHKMSSVMTTDHHERGYEAADWAIVRWYDMLPTIMGRGLPRRRATIRNVMTGEIRDIPLTRCMGCGYWSMHWSPCFRCGYPFCTSPRCSTVDTFRAASWRNRMWGSVMLCTHCHEMIEIGRANRNAAAQDAYLNTRARRRFGL